MSKLRMHHRNSVLQVPRYQISLVHPVYVEYNLCQMWAADIGRAVQPPHSQSLVTLALISRLEDREPPQVPCFAVRPINLHELSVDNDLAVNLAPFYDLFQGPHIFVQL